MSTSDRERYIEKRADALLRLAELGTARHDTESAAQGPTFDATEEMIAQAKQTVAEMDAILREPRD